jgi:3-deoxy-D-manno-octulosonic-acid transferase
MQFLYNLGIRLYALTLWFVAFYNPKAKLWIEGRKNWRRQLLSKRDKIRGCFWFHFASLGEFEQGRPLMEALKKVYPETPLLITFFSPSGYENKKRYSLAEHVCYLPIDTPGNARYFVNAIRPKAVFFVKYEFWHNLLHEVARNKIPLYNIAGNFRSNQRFFTKKNKFYSGVLRNFSHFFVQNQQSKVLLQSIGIDCVSVCGDTRYDRVWQNAQNVVRNEVIEDFIGDEQVLILGSTWAVEHEFLIPLINDGIIKEKVIIAPHETDSKSLKYIENLLNVPNFRYSHHEDYAKKEHKRVMIIDGIGMLANAYFYGTYAYVGGAFGKGLHNILEPAVFGLPVIFGPNTEKFPEAKEFIAHNCGFSVHNKQDFLERREFILENLEVLREATKNFIKSKIGATDMILKVLKQDLS